MVQGPYKHPREDGWNFVSHRKIGRHHGSYGEILVTLKIKKAGELCPGDSGEHSGQ